MSRVPRFERKNPYLVYETIDGETVIVNLKSGNYYSLVGVGSTIWTELEGGRTVDEIVARLGTEYEGKPQEISTGVDELLESLAKEELIAFETPDEEPPAALPTNHSASAESKRKFQAPRLQKFV